jgi:hypothetical protein
MRSALVLIAIASPAAADTFGGFSGVDRPYLVNQDRVCKPLEVTAGAAHGAPTCETAKADVVARLSVKEGVAQRGSKAVFAASVSGQTLTVTRKAEGDAVVTWDAPDPIGKVVDVFASQYEDRIAVTFTVRRAGRELVDVVAFDLQKGGAAVKPPDPTPTNPTNPTNPAPVEDPKLTEAVKAAHATPSTAKWNAVLAIDKDHSEAIYKLAALAAAAKKPAEALDLLGGLAKSSRDEAAEWLVEARFDPAFAGLRGDAKFRDFVGFDRKARSTYEKMMGFGGQWEQNGTSCDTPEVHVTAGRDRSVKIRVKSACQGAAFDTTFKGTWKIDGNRILVVLPNHGKATEKDEAPCSFDAHGDEDALHCRLGHDIEFVALPTRR